MPTHRISPAEQTRQSLEQFLSGGLVSEEEPTSTLVRLAARVVLQEALEVEQRDVVGRDRYQRGSDGRYRNGYRPGHLDSAEGRIDLQVPQVRGVPGYHSKLLEFLGDNSEVLEQLVTEMYARGLSTRDVEDALTDATGECILGRSAVSELTDRLWEEYEAFCARDLSGFEVTYLFVDAIYESLRLQGGPKEALLCAWGICEDGRKVLLHLGGENLPPCFALCSCTISGREKTENELGLTRHPPPSPEQPIKLIEEPPSQRTGNDMRRRRALALHLLTGSFTRPTP